MSKHSKLTGAIAEAKREGRFFADAADEQERLRIRFEGATIVDVQFVDGHWTVITNVPFEYRDGGRKGLTALIFPCSQVMIGGCQMDVKSRQ
jgi:hypothetical protein